MPGPDRNSFVLGPVPTTINELRKQIDKNVVDVTEVQAQVADIEPVAQTISVTAGAGGVFIGTVSTFDDASQVAQVDVAGTLVSMDNYSGRALAPGNLVACSYLTDQPTVAVIVGVFRGEGYEPPTYTTPIVPASFPVFGEGLSNPIIGNLSFSYANGGQRWDQDFSDQLGRGVDSIVALGRFFLPSPYPVTTSATGVVVYNQATASVSFITGPSGGSYANGPVIVSGGIFVTAGSGEATGRLYFHDVATQTWSQVTANDVGYPMVSAGGYTWLYEENLSGADWLLAVSIDLSGVPAVSRAAVLSDIATVNWDDIHMTAGGNVLWLCDGATGTLQYINTDPSLPNLTRYQSSAWGGGVLATRLNSGADDNGNLNIILFNGTNYNNIRINATFGTFETDTYSDIFDPTALPQEIHCVVPAGPNAVYVGGLVLAEDIDEVYNGTGLLMPVIWEVNMDGPAAFTSLIWTGTDFAVPYATVLGLDRRGADALTWLVTTTPDTLTKETYVFRADI